MFARSFLFAILLFCFALSTSYADKMPPAKRPTVKAKSTAVLKKAHKHRRVRKSHHAKATSPKATAPKVEIRHDVPAPGNEGEGRDMWFYQRRAWPNAEIDPAMYPAALDAARKMPKLNSFFGKNRPASSFQWTSIGPYSIDGRISCIATHPTDPNTFYVGAASGGLWRTSDDGASWTCVTDTFGSLAMGAVAIDPVDPHTLYLGQGESNYSGDTYPGYGLWKSTNEGATWMYLGFGKTQYISKILIDAQDHNRILVAIPGAKSASDSNRGVYISTDAGANWTRSLLVRAGKGRVSTPVPIIDLAVNQNNSNELLAFSWHQSGNENNCGQYTGVWRSADGGGSWIRVDTMAGSGLPNGMNERVLSRGALYWSAGNGSTSYAYVALTRADTNEVTHWRTDVNFKGLYRSSDGGLHWEKTIDSTYQIPYGLRGRDSCDALNKQGGYNLYLAGNPLRPNELYFGGIDILRSTDYGQTFTDIARSYSEYYIGGSREQHSDQHGLAFSSATTGDDLIAVSDGGVFNTTDFGTNWKQVPGLPITMFYGIEPWAAGMTDIGPIVQPDQLRLFGGTQDNGTVAKGLTTDADFVWVNHGDGGVAQSHPTDKEKLISSLQLGEIFARNSIDSLTTVTPTRDANGRNAAWHRITNRLLRGGITDTAEPAGFIAPVVLDRERPTELYTGRLHVYKAVIDWSDLDHVKWYNWSPVIAGDPSHPERWYYGDIETIALGARDTRGRPMLWAGGYIYQTPSSSLWRTVYDADRPDTVAPTWIKVNTGLPGTTISSIVPDRSDSLTAFITTLGSNASDNQHVLMTTDGGAHWTNISGNLPHAPVSALVIDTAAEHGDPMLKNHCLIVASDVGVYATTDGGAHWAALADNLPNVVVGDVQIYKNLLIAATHGRSLYAMDISSLRAAIAGVPLTTIADAAVYPNPVVRGSSITIQGGARDAAQLVSEVTGVTHVLETRSAGESTRVTVPASIAPGAYKLFFRDAEGRDRSTSIVVLP